MYIKIQIKKPGNVQQIATCDVTAPLILVPTRLVMNRCLLTVSSVVLHATCDLLMPFFPSHKQEFVNVAWTNKRKQASGFECRVAVKRIFHQCNNLHFGLCMTASESLFLEIPQLGSA